MSNSTKQLLVNLENKAMSFQHVLNHIDNVYDFIATEFSNGQLQNSRDENQGSCKVFAFAQLNNLDKQQTLSLFAEHYQNVLENPEEISHQNIRQFISNGWEGINFEGIALTAKKI